MNDFIQNLSITTPYSQSELSSIQHEHNLTNDQLWDVVDITLSHGLSLLSVSTLLCRLKRGAVDGKEAGTILKEFLLNFQDNGMSVDDTLDAINTLKNYE